MKKFCASKKKGSSSSRSIPPGYLARTVATPRGPSSARSALEDAPSFTTRPQEALAPTGLSSIRTKSTDAPSSAMSSRAASIHINSSLSNSSNVVPQCTLGSAAKENTTQPRNASADVMPGLDNDEIEEVAPLETPGDYVLCPPFEELDSIPLPPYALKDESQRETTTPLKDKNWSDNYQIFVERYEKAKAERERHTALDRAPRKGRSGSNPKTKRPKDGFRVVIKWDEEGTTVLGEWGDKFIEYIGCFARRADLFNPYYSLIYQPFKSFKFVWKDINHYFILDGNPKAWKFVFHDKLPRALGELKSSLKKNYFNKYNTDWERFWNLPTHNDPIQFAALCCYWETEDSEIISKINSENRQKIICDHHLGRKSYAQLQYKKGEAMQVHEFAKAALGTFHPKYDNEDKKRNNLKMLESLDVSFTEASKHLKEVEGEKASLSREAQDKVVESVFGPAKKNWIKFGGGTKRVKADNPLSMTGDWTKPTNVRMMEEVIKTNNKQKLEIETLKEQNEMLFNFFKELHPDMAQRMMEARVRGSIVDNQDIEQELDLDREANAKDFSEQEKS